MLTTWEYFNKMTKVLTTEANDEIRVAIEIDPLTSYKKIVMCDSRENFNAAREVRNSRQFESLDEFEKARIIFTIMSMSFNANMRYLTILILSILIRRNGDVHLLTLNLTILLNKSWNGQMAKIDKHF